MSKHNPDQVAHITAILLASRHDAEPHHVRATMDTARLILDEAYAPDAEEEPAGEPADEAEPTPTKVKAAKEPAPPAEQSAE